MACFYLTFTMKSQSTLNILILLSFQTMRADDVICTRVYERQWTALLTLSSFQSPFLLHHHLHHLSRLLRQHWEIAVCSFIPVSLLASLCNKCGNCSMSHVYAIVLAPDLSVCLSSAIKPDQLGFKHVRCFVWTVCWVTAHLFGIVCVYECLSCVQVRMAAEKVWDYL